MESKVGETSRLKSHRMKSDSCSSKDVVSDDGLPIIGLTSQKGVYMATGFGFWGMNNGTIGNGNYRSYNRQTKPIR